jgi:hypothetical protein
VSQAALEQAVHNAVTGVWVGALFPIQAQATLTVAVQRYLEEAWARGAQACGVAPEELSENERVERWNFITTQQAFVGRLVNAVYAHREATGGRIEPFLARVPLWGQRYHHAVQLAKTMACADLKAMWTYGDTLEHCSDCSKVAGRVHRRSIWQKYGWVPGSRALACGGWRCDCRLEDTTAPALPGHPPYVRGNSR